MAHKIRYVAQILDDTTGAVVGEEVLSEKALKRADDFNELGLRHEEQIQLIKLSQDFFLTHQCQLFFDDDLCPSCGNKVRKQGKVDSDFHDVLTDHRVSIPRLHCRCGWKNDYTINSLYGDASHPELVKLQVATGANYSFKKTSTILNAYCHTPRKINNTITIMRKVTKIGELLDQEKKSLEWSQSEHQAQSLILTTDGGHVQHQEVGSHSFKELISTAYRPEDIVNLSGNRREIKHKISVASAKRDKQISIKQLTLNACKKLGMTKQTKLTALCDGAKNCWSVIDSIVPHCGEVIKIVDWFHIGKKFKEHENRIPEELKEIYDKAKWHCWHGRPLTGIIRLKQVKKQITNEMALDKLQTLINYINNNEDNIINYHIRKLNQKVYTSQLAESSVNSVINDRQKNKKMQWTRAGAHNILQIRTSQFSKTWNTDWKNVEAAMYHKAA